MNLAGQWRLGDVIAHGGFATVFRGEGAAGQEVAVKVLHAHLARDAELRARFLREGTAANQVDHPGAVRVLESGTTKAGVPYLAMELFADGETLEERRQRLGGRLGEDEVVELSGQLLDVLERAHARGIVHRDIKPDNLYLLPDGTLKVLDFGIAKMREALARSETTRTGVFLGTPDFMAPEQVAAKRDAIDARTDIYGVGATMFLLLAGEPVHLDHNLARLLRAVANKPARSLASAVGGLSARLVHVVDRALAFDPDARWPSAREMREAMHDGPAAPVGAAVPSTARADTIEAIDGGEEVDEATTTRRLSRAEVMAAWEHALAASRDVPETPVAASAAPVSHVNVSVASVTSETPTARRPAKLERTRARALLLGVVAGTATLVWAAARLAGVFGP